MRKKNGYTLIELMAVFVIIALILALTVPNVLKLSNSAKTKAYSTKVSLIESAGEQYGISNLSSVRNSTLYCNISNGTINESSTASTGYYSCEKHTVAELIGQGFLTYDEKDVCKSSATNACTEDNKIYYDNVVINPLTKNIINYCYVYVYYKYERIYAAFDKETCDVPFKTEFPTAENNYPDNNKYHGHEYAPLTT